MPELSPDTDTEIEELRYGRHSMFTDRDTGTKFFKCRMDRAGYIARHIRRGNEHHWWPDSGFIPVDPKAVGLDKTRQRKDPAPFRMKDRVKLLGSHRGEAFSVNAGNNDEWDEAHWMGEVPPVTRADFAVEMGPGWKSLESKLRTENLMINAQPNPTIPHGFAVITRETPNGLLMAMIVCRCGKATLAELFVADTACMGTLELDFNTPDGWYVDPRSVGLKGSTPVVRCPDHRSLI